MPIFDVTETKPSNLRVALVLGNLLFVATPAVAAAHGGGMAAHAAGGCFAAMFGVAIQSAATPKKRKSLGYRGEAARMHTSLRGRCLINEIAGDCIAKAVAVEGSGNSLASKQRALIYYNKACKIGPDRAPCIDAKRVANSIGCEDPIVCEQPSGKPLGKRFDTAAAKTAFADGVDRVVTECENDEPQAREVRVTVRFGVSGQPASVTLEPKLDKSLIAACIEQIYREVSVPAFDGDDTTASMIVPLAEVPSAFHLVHRRR